MKKFMLFALALALGVAMAVPVTALAAEAPGYNVVIGARIRANWTYKGIDKEQTQSNKDIVKSTLSVSGSSYFRATFTSSDKKVGARVEMGLGSSVSRRTVYGWYKIGNCKIVAGNNYMWYSEIVCPASWTSDCWGIGHLDHGRQPSIAFEYEKGMFGLQVMVREPRTAGAPAEFDKHYMFPGLTVSTKIKAGAFGAYPGFYFTNAKWEKAEGSDGDDSSNYWSVNLPMQVKFGALTIGGSIFYAVNVGYESVSLVGPADNLAVPVSKANGDLEDTTSVGGFVALKYQAGPAQLVAGFGAQSFSNDEWKNTLGYDKTDFTQYVYYVGCNYKLHKYLLLRPEFSYQDYGDDPVDGQNAGNTWILGFRFQFVF